MKSSSTKISLAALAALTSLAGFAHNATAAVVINEIYGGGGFSISGTLPASTYNSDFVELYNNTATPVDISGYVLKYGSATGTGTMANLGSASVTIPAGTTLAGLTTYLIGEATTAGTGVGAPLPTPDITGTTNLGSTAGKVGLYSSTATDGSNIVDFVGFGSTAAVYEGTAPAAGPGGTGPAAGLTSINRVLGVDTNSNSADFVLAAPTPMASTPEPVSLGLVTTAGALLVARRRR